MNIKNLIVWFVEWPANIFSYLQDILALGIRLYVGWQFFHAGMLKINAWDATLFLFQYEYKVPILSPYIAAVIGTAGELIFPVFLWIGLASRLSALGLQLVNVMAVVAYAHVIFNPEFGSSAAVDHYFWGLMILVIMIYGPGRLSIDGLLTRFNATTTQHLSGHDLTKAV